MKHVKSTQYSSYLQCKKKNTKCTSSFLSQLALGHYALYGWGWSDLPDFPYLDQDLYLSIKLFVWKNLVNSLALLAVPYHQQVGTVDCSALSSPCEVWTKQRYQPSLVLCDSMLRKNKECHGQAEIRFGWLKWESWTWTYGLALNAAKVKVLSQTNTFNMHCNFLEIIPMPIMAGMFLNIWPNFFLPIFSEWTQKIIMLCKNIWFQMSWRYVDPEGPTHINNFFNKALIGWFIELIIQSGNNTRLF